MPIKSVATAAIDSAFSRWGTRKKQEVAAVEPMKETAALSLEQPDLCPYCKSTMKPAIARGIQVYTCDADRHVAPARNEEPTI